MHKVEILWIKSTQIKWKLVIISVGYKCIKVRLTRILSLCPLVQFWGHHTSYSPFTHAVNVASGNLHRGFNCNASSLNTRTAQDEPTVSDATCIPPDPRSSLSLGGLYLWDYHTHRVCADDFTALVSVISILSTCTLNNAAGLFMIGSAVSLWWVQLC